MDGYRGRLPGSVLAMPPARIMQLRKMNTRTLITSAPRLRCGQGIRQEVNHQAGGTIQENQFAAYDAILDFCGEFWQIRQERRRGGLQRHCLRILLD